MNPRILLALALVSYGCSSGDSSTSSTSSPQYPYPPAPPPVLPPAAPPIPNAAQAVSSVVLVTNQTNPDVVNAWGLAFNAAAGPAWIADNATGKVSVYPATNALQLTVTLPPAAGAPKSLPTGVAYNPIPQAFGGDTFVFVSEDGVISGWQMVNGTAATVRVDNSATQALYKGATIASVAGAPRLYAANFRAAKIDVFDQTYAPIPLGPGAFVDPTLPPGFAPFNVKAVGNFVLVTYALQDATKRIDVPALGNGFVDAYDPDGTFRARLDTRGLLNSPWGVAVTPATFGRIPNRLLVGNFGDGVIIVYALDPTGLVATFEGRLPDRAGAPIVIPGLWALEFAPNVGGFTAQQLFFTAGPNGGTGGVYGRLDIAP